MAFQPPNFSDDPFKQLKDRVRHHLKEEMIDEKIVDLVKTTGAELLQKENIVLSRTEQNRLLQTVLKETLSDILTKL
jgi:hypothetical protein